MRAHGSTDYAMQVYFSVLGKCFIVKMQRLISFHQQTVAVACQRMDLELKKKIDCLIKHNFEYRFHLKSGF